MNIVTFKSYFWYEGVYAVVLGSVEKCVGFVCVLF